MMEGNAFFSDTTDNYVDLSSFLKNNQVKIYFRAAHKNENEIKEIFLRYHNISVEMQYDYSDEMFSYYCCSFQVMQHEISYYFEIVGYQERYFYNTLGVVDAIDTYYNFRLMPSFVTPDWAKGAVMYQIYVDRFCNGDPSNDVVSREYYYLDNYVKKVEDWKQPPSVLDVHNFYGGDLQGVLDRLDYLQDLGVEVIYFNPLFVSPSNHKYDTQDYDYIDPHYGRIVVDQGEVLEEGVKDNIKATKYRERVARLENLEASNQFFAEVVGKIHDRGMKVILDGVFNHCGSFHKWLDREGVYEGVDGYESGAFRSKDSPYVDYFQFHEDTDWPNNYSYDGWWGHHTLPKLNYEGSEKLCDYICKTGQKWVSEPYCVDGWRLDVAADLGHSREFNHAFWAHFRKEVKKANANALILAEHYEDSTDWLQGNEWDTIMNYSAFMEPITWFLTGMQKHSDEFREDLLGNADAFWGAMHYHMQQFTNESLFVSMNELSNHDHSRFLTRTNRKVGRLQTLGTKEADTGINKAVFREAVVMQMTWIGAPTIYYGDEAGVCGFTDPDNRRTFPWGYEDQELISFHKELIKIHKSYPEWKKGSLRELYRDYNILGYGRFTKDSQSIVLINNRDVPVELEVIVWPIGIPRECVMDLIFISTEKGYSTNIIPIEVKDGKIRIVMGKTAAFILHYENSRS